MFRDGFLWSQAAFPSSCRRMYLAGFLGSTDIIPLRRYYEPRDFLTSTA
jgi:hypothetical protein